MASFTGESVWAYLNLILRRKKQHSDVVDLSDETIQSKLGTQWDALCEAGRAHVEGTGGNAVTQTITLTLKVKTFRTENNEIANEVTARIKSVVPDIPLPSKLVYLDHDGVCHTTPQQVDLPLMGVKGVVEGGKRDASNEGRKVNVK